jgi:hypothetical protein
VGVLDHDHVDDRPQVGLQDDGRTPLVEATRGGCSVRCGHSSARTAPYAAYEGHAYACVRTTVGGGLAFHKRSRCLRAVGAMSEYQDAKIAVLAQINEKRKDAG